VTVRVPSGIRHFEISSMQTAYDKEKNIVPSEDPKED